MERLSQPTSFWASSTTVGVRAQRSGGPSPMPDTGRAQPTSGCTPDSLAVTENSSAPNRLARSVRPTAGMCSPPASAPTTSALIAPSSSE